MRNCVTKVEIKNAKMKENSSLVKVLRKGKRKRGREFLPYKEKARKGRQKSISTAGEIYCHLFVYLSLPL